MNSEVPYEGVGSIHSLVKLIDPCVRKQGLYAHPLFPDAVFSHECVYQVLNLEEAADAF